MPPFSTFKTGIYGVIAEEADHIYIKMPMYNLIGYSDKYSDTSRSLWQFKKDGLPTNNDGLTTEESKSF